MNYNIMIKCPICGKTFSKNKYRAKDNPNCRKCNMKKTYSEHPEKLHNALEKRKETCKKVYGTENVAQNKDVKEKYINTQIQKYGGMGGFSYKNENAQKAAHTEEANKKREETCLKHFGTTHQMKNKKFVESVMQKTIDKYGCVGPVARYQFLDKIFDSSWEVAYYIWLSDHNKQFVYHPNMYFEYIGNDGLSHKYYPDFLIEGVFYEIKGNQFFNDKGEPFNFYKKEYWWEKYNALKANNVVILRENDMKEILNYVNSTYGNQLLKECKIKK